MPGTHPRYNTAYDLAHSYLTERLTSETLSELEAKRQAHDKQALFDVARSTRSAARPTC